MYVSVDTTYRPQDYRVFLDGELLRDCKAADDVEGYAIVNERNAEGKCFARDGAVATRRVEGRIEIFRRVRE